MRLDIVYQETAKNNSHEGDFQPVILGSVFCVLNDLGFIFADLFGGCHGGRGVLLAPGPWREDDHYGRIPGRSPQR